MDETWEGEIVEENTHAESFNDEGNSSLPVISYNPLQTTKTPFVTAVAVQTPRSIARVEKAILTEAALLGTSAYYGWGKGKNHVEGGTVHLATAMLRAYGNCTVVADAIQETPSAWIFLHTTVDLESGTALPRQYYQSKRELVEGKMPEDRKNNIRFNKGQSKSIRNSIFNAMPRWLMLKAITEAKKGVRKKIETFIAENSLAAAQLFIVSQLKKVGVTEDQILQKTERTTIEGLTIDDIVQLSGDEKAISSGSENVDALFERKNGKFTDLKDQVRAKAESSVQNKNSEAINTDIEVIKGMKVTLGKKPGQYLVSDNSKEFLVEEVNSILYCICQGNTSNPSVCLHILAVQQYISN